MAEIFRGHAQDAGSFFQRVIPLYHGLFLLPRSGVCGLVVASQKGRQRSPEHSPRPPMSPTSIVNHRRVNARDIAAFQRVASDPTRTARRPAPDASVLAVAPALPDAPGQAVSRRRTIGERGKIPLGVKAVR